MNAEFHAHVLSRPELSVLLASTASVAVLHTLAGPDHYLPFVVLGRARRWSVARTVFWTTLCGVGHVASSVVLAIAGVIFGLGLERVQFIEEIRGNLAAWAMIAFGAVYCAWGLKKALRSRPHAHPHTHGGRDHEHLHAHGGAHAHPHGETEGFKLTPWILFTIFVFGPCEPMIPLVMYPATQGSWSDVWVIVGVFGALTIGSMLGVVLLARQGVQSFAMPRIERFSHAAAGGTICAAGCAMQFFGL